MTYQRILFASDFSESARHALAETASMARQLKAEIHLIHVLALHDADPAVAADLLLSAVPSGVDDVVTERSIVRGLRPELGIIHTAREGGYDLISLGTHGRTGLKHVVMGSVAERVVQLASCPVMTVRQAGQAFEHPEHADGPADEGEG